MPGFKRTLGLCAVLLWTCAALPVTAQTTGANSATTGQGSQDDDAVNPLVQGLFNAIIDEIERSQQQNGQTGTTPQPTQPTQTQPTQPQPRDRTPPVIRPARPEFTGDRGSVRVEATITDQSALSWAELRWTGGRGRMRPLGQNRYAGDVKLPPNYQPSPLAIVARDVHGNTAGPVQVLVRRLPACGQKGGATLTLVRSVQTSLQELGALSGGIDGLAGPGTCGAIRTVGIQEPFSWPDLARDLEAKVDDARLSPVPPTVPEVDPGAFQTPQADQDPSVPEQEDAPSDGAQVSGLTVPSSGSNLPGIDTSTVPAPRSVNLPDWAIPAALGFLGALGVFWGISAVAQRRAHQPDEVRPAVPPMLRVTAHPDISPETAMTGAQLPGLLLTVAQGPAPGMTVEFEKEAEGVPT